MPEPAVDGRDPSAIYLLGRIEGLHERVRAAVRQRQAVDPDPEDRFRGLYITDEQAATLFENHPASSTAAPLALDGRVGWSPLEQLEGWADRHEEAGGAVRLRSASRNLGLTPFEAELLVVALAPDLDPRFEKAYGYLHDDVTRRRCSIGLALELAGAGAADGWARGRFLPGAPLVRTGLVVIEDADRPFLTRSLRVADHVVSHLLGEDVIEPAVADLLGEGVCSEVVGIERLAGALRAGRSLVYLRDRIGAATVSFAVSAAAHAGIEAVVIDLERLAAGADVSAAARAVERHVRLGRRLAVVGPVDLLAQRGADAVRAFSETDAMTVLIGSQSWDPLWSRQPPLLLDAPDAPAASLRWAGGSWFRLTPEQFARAELAAELAASSEGVELTEAHLSAGARSQNAGGLERLALRVQPRAQWSDLVLPPVVDGQLRELVARVRHRDQVLDAWGFEPSGTKGRGVTALFAGDSGTGKTLSAEVVAGELGLDLYVVDLATVVDKYIGETEKNLDRIFREADRVNGVLLFDEADAIFGKRSEVQDARDRYANVEVAYLLQRMERFDGIAILTTNLRANLDDAFLRRIDVLIDFPLPDEVMRRRLWACHLPSQAPTDGQLDLEFLARAFNLPGGNIRNIALAGAFLAAEENGPLTMATLIRGTAGEYRKLGRLCVEAEFGRYHHLVNELVAPR